LIDRAMYIDCTVHVTLENFHVCTWLYNKDAL